jgi:hypothetical protein
VPGVAGLASLVLISITSAAVTLLRRQRTRQLLLARVAARVASVGGATPPARPGAPASVLPRSAPDAGKRPSVHVR